MTTAVQEIQFHSMVNAIDIWHKLPEGVRAEVINNRLYILASPTSYHQKVLAVLTRQIDNYVCNSNLGTVWYSPIDVFPDPEKHNAVVPDIVYVSHENQLQIERRGLYGAPDLLIEILSPGTEVHDFVTKKDLYERVGVREYWLVDPETKHTAGYQLKEGAYGSPLIMNSKIDIRIFNRQFSF